MYRWKKTLFLSYKYQVWKWNKIGVEKHVHINTTVWMIVLLPFWDDVDVGRDGSFVAAMPWIQGKNASMIAKRARAP